MKCVFDALLIILAININCAMKLSLLLFIACLQRTRIDRLIIITKVFLHLLLCLEYTGRKCDQHEIRASLQFRINRCIVIGRNLRTWLQGALNNELLVAHPSRVMRYQVKGAICIPHGHDVHICSKSKGSATVVMLNSVINDPVRFMLTSTYTPSHFRSEPGAKIFI